MIHILSSHRSRTDTAQIIVPSYMSHASIDAKTRAERNLAEDLIRLCVGIEDCDDLIDDLQTAVSDNFPLHLKIILYVWIRF